MLPDPVEGGGAGIAADGLAGEEPVAGEADAGLKEATRL